MARTQVLLCCMKQGSLSFALTLSTEQDDNFILKLFYLIATIQVQN